MPLQIHVLSHINRVTQYENPVTEAKRRYAGAQLPQHLDDTRGAAPPLRARPSMQSAAALEKQREAEAAAQWPEAGLASDYLDYPGNQGGDRPGELLQIKTIQKGSAADKDGRLQVGEVIVYINGISVLTYNHHKVVDLFKSIPMGSTVTLEVRRGYPLPDYQDDKLPPYTASSNQNFPRQSPVPPVGYRGAEPGNTFQHAVMDRLSINIVKGPLGFGFSLGGAADLDGRLQIGDEITQINGRSVLDAAHQDVINYMGEAAAQGEVTLKIRRKVPPLELNPHTSYMPAEDNEPLIPQGIRRVLITRPNTQTSFGFVLQSNTLRAGCIVCRLVQGSPADQSGQLYQFDELISVNGQDVSRMDHSDVVTLIKASGTTITLEVQQKQDLELVKQQQLMDNQPPPQQAIAVVMDNRGRSYSGNTNTLTSSGNYPGNAPSGGTMPGPTTFASQYSVNGGGAPGLQYTGPAGGTFPRNGGGNYPGSSGGVGGGGGLENSYNGPDDDAGPQISANLDGFASDDEDILHIEIHRDGTGFGFSIRGGAEYNAPLCVLRMAPGGAAERDGRLRVGDELLEINGNSTEGMGHADAITIIKHGGDIVKLTVRRLPESLSGRNCVGLLIYFHGTSEWEWDMNITYLYQ
ncbi:hypothetical protein EMCRGX_G003360 [Ephydatia muelleri]